MRYDDEDQRVINFMKMNSPKCLLFRIGSDNEWYIKGNVKPLYDWEDEALEELFENIEENSDSYNTLRNVATIKKELKRWNF